MTETPPDWSAGRENPTLSGPVPVPPAPHPYAYPPGPYPGGYPGGPYPGGYPPPMPYGDYTPAPRNGLGIGALVTAIVALVSSFSIIGGIVLGLVAVVLGFLGRARVKRGEADNGGVALAGIVLGVVAVIAGLSFIAVWVGLFKQVGANDYFDCLQQAGQDREKVQMCSDEFRSSVESRFSNPSQPGR
ncbi:MAG: DUF4190 domain-containing protein [Mycobacteriaceae bacterium]